MLGRKTSPVNTDGGEFGLGLVFDNVHPAKNIWKVKVPSVVGVYVVYVPPVSSEVNGPSVWDVPSGFVTLTVIFPNLSP